MTLTIRSPEEQRAYREGTDLALRSAVDLLRKHPEAQKIIATFREAQRLMWEAIKPSGEPSTSEARR